VPRRASSLNPQEPSSSRPVPSPCPTCHDGAIARSIDNDAANKRGHPIGVAVPVLSTSLPLDHGKIACTTCHDQHADGLLRVDNSDGTRLCRNCHQELAQRRR
jgi:predicted CXXCH cytochrome family protein